MFYTCLCTLRTQRTVLWYSIIHLGYYGDGLNAIIVFAVCFMPESNQPNYRYIMDNLFKWVFLWAPLTLWSQLFSSGANGICPPQVRHRHAGAAGGRELHDRLPERGHVPEEDADRGLAEEVLPADRQEVSWRLALTRGRRSDGWLTAAVAVPAQVKKEPEVSDNRPSLLVHPYPPGTHETLHKVRGHCNYPIKEMPGRVARFWPSRLFTAPNSVRKSSMFTAWRTWQSWSRWSMCQYQIASNSESSLQHTQWSAPSN